MRPRPERLRPRHKNFFEAKATMYEAEARHVSVCMSMKTKILTFRT